SAAHGEAGPVIAQASGDHEADPAHPYWHCPRVDDDGPAHDKTQQMQQCNQRENYSRYSSKTFSQSWRNLPAEEYIWRKLSSGCCRFHMGAGAGGLALADAVGERRICATESGYAQQNRWC